MKKKISLLIVSLSLLFGFVSAQNITFDVQGDGNFGYGCIVPVDVYVDTQGSEISAIDLVLESSMEYKDFENTNVMPYYFPPKVNDNGLVHIVGFSVEPSERFVGKDKIGTLYFKQKEGSIDGLVRLYFLGEGETIDTNLSIAGGIDVLRQVGDAYVRFDESLPACETEYVELELENIDGYANKSYDESMNQTLSLISKNHPSAINQTENIVDTMSKNDLCIVIWIAGILLLLIIIFVVYKILSNKKGENKGSI